MEPGLDEHTHTNTPLSPDERKLAFQKGRMLMGLIVVIVILMAAGLASATYYFGRQSASPVVSTLPTTNVFATPSAIASTYPYSAPSPKSTPTPLYTPSTNATTTDVQGVTWYNEPQPLPALKLIPPEFSGESYYYNVGNDHGQDVIVALSWDGPGPYGLDILLKKDDTHYELLTKLSQDTTDGGFFNSNLVNVNNDKDYPSLHNPETLTINKNTLKAASSAYNFFVEYQKNLSITTSTVYPSVQASRDANTIKLDKITTTPNGDVYLWTKTIPSQQSGGEPNIGSAFVLKHADGTASEYQSYPAFIKDDSIPQITWNDKTKNLATYANGITHGCGQAAGIRILPDSDMNTLKAAGKSSTGETIYEFTSADNPVLKEYFDTIANNGTYYDTVTQKVTPITIQDYYNHHGVFVYKDKFNRLIPYQNTTMSSEAECGKPVVYLYPTKTTDVSMKVGANITKSDPTYNTGWNVTAHPDGSLVNKDGNTYDSLFWEGTGKGTYPDITQGFVVAQKDLQATMRDHLSKLGLNQKEAADFMAFWLPKMPTTPYVRLTWFGTKQMDQLAPLTITPKPDTVIRIFLDFEGLQQPISLPAEQLGATPRQGFTAIEWGGLLRR